MNRELLQQEIERAETGDTEAQAVVREVLRPLQTDSVDQIYEKLRIFNRLIFLASMKYKDSDAHKEIDRFYAEQIHSFLTTGAPKYNGFILIGYRESAKTTRVKFGQVYLAAYLPDFIDLVSVVSEDGESANQFNMDIFNSLAFSKISRYFPDLISTETRTKKKESQTMSRFTTTNGVTYHASSARKSKRGNVKMDVDDETGEISTKRPKLLIFDDIENETTVRSIPATRQIESVMNASIDGLDQTQGFWILLGNYLSLRGNVAKFLTKYRYDARVKTIQIDILDGLGNVTWPDKYVATDREEAALLAQGIVRKSVESIKRKSDNFELEFMNNPSKSTVYFKDAAIDWIRDDELRDEVYRDGMGYLQIEEPEPNATYVACVDAGKGVGSDNSAFVILKLNGKTYREVANFKSNQLSPEKFATYSYPLFAEYNNAVAIVENNYPGNEYIAFLIQFYKHVYGEKNAQGDIEYGINTNRKTKPEMFLNVKDLLINRLLTVTSRYLFDQISEYPENEVLNVRDSDEGHFDMLMALCVGAYKIGAVAGGITGSSLNTEAVDRRIAQIVSQNVKAISNYR